jgi:hypothetical protein
LCNNQYFDKADNDMQLNALLCFPLQQCLRGKYHNITKAKRCGACYYSIVLNAHRVTSMADTDTDAVRKQKKAEYEKQYRLKRKLLLQQQASKDIRTHDPVLYP